MSEKKNKKLSESLRLLIDYILDPVVLVDGNGRLIGINKAMTRYSEYQMEQQVGKNFTELDFFSEETKRLIQNNLKQRLMGKDVPRYEIRTEPKGNQEPLCLEVIGNLIRDGEETFTITVLHDVTERLKSQEALQRGLLETEEKFQAIIDSIKEAIILVDGEAKITYWNPAAERIFGFTSQEAIGKKIHELIAPKKMYNEAKDRIENSVKLFSETGTGYFTVSNVQLSGSRKDASDVPVELSLSPVNLNGKWNAVGVVKDISDRKQAERKLKDAEQRYHTLFNQAPLGVLVIDPETASFVEFNNVAHLNLGYTREEFGKLTVFDIDVVDKPEQVKSRISEMIQQGGGEFETKHRTKTGEIRNVVVTIKKFISGNKSFLHTIFHDITELKKTESALVESEARYRQLVEVAREGIWAIDDNFISTFVNPRMAEMIGYRDCEILGKSLFNFIDASMVDKIRSILQEFIVKDIRGQYEYAFPRKNGTRIETSVTLSRIMDDSGNRVGILAVVADITERKKMEEALKKSEELSRAIVAYAPIGIATVDRSYHFVSANEAFCNILGYTERELRNITFKSITHPDDMQISEEKVAALVQGKIQSFVQEKRYIKKDGTVIVGRVIINILRNGEGQPMFTIVELEDITQRKELEEDVRESEQKFRAISNSATDAIILSDEDGTILYWNPTAEKMIGFTKEEAVGSKLAELVIPPYGQARHIAVLKEMAIQSGPSQKHFCFNAKKRDGTKFPIDLSVVSVKLKDKNCLLSIVRDITEWKALEEALRQERDMLENMAANIDAGLTIISRDYRVVWANQLIKKISGRQDIENASCYSVFNNDASRVCEGCGVRNIFEKDAKIDRHDFHVNRCNPDKWVELIVTPVKDKEGKVIAALELAVDITERKLLQDKLAEYSLKLEEIVQQRTEQLKKTQAELVKSERLAAIGELAGMVGHDLRNPLTGIKNSAYFLKKKNAVMTPEQTREILETIDKCVNYSNRIVNDLLDYSREIHLDLRKESLRTLLTESLILLDIPKKVEIVNNLLDQPVLAVDPDKIKRLFVNLIKNAIDAMPNGGKIIVESSVVDGNMEICFSDTGAGISEDILPKLFSPLCTTKAQGMGFGLAICKRIVEAHDGRISVKTTLKKGTTFTITLPIDHKKEDGGEKVWINMPESSWLTTMKR